MLLFFRVLGIILLIILFVCICLCVIILCSEVKIIVNKIQYKHLKNKNKIEYSSKFALYFFGKIKWFQLKISNESLNKNKFIKKQFDEIKNNSNNKVKEQEKKIIKFIREILKKLNIEKLDLNIKIDTENVVVTSYLIGIISIIIPNLIRKNIKKFSNGKYRWDVEPVYNNQNYIYLDLQSIFSIKVVHIINILKNV